MGAWITLHVFDPEKFQNELVPLIKGQKGSLEADYQRYLLTCLRHQSSLDIGQIIEISRQFDDTMSHFSGYVGKTNSEGFWDVFDWHYEYARFFTVMMFTYCADLYPYFRTGKHSIATRISYRQSQSLAENILWKLYDHRHFSPHSSGISGWLNCEELDLLIMDFDKIDSSDFPDMHNDVGLFIQKLATQNLSILQTMDVDQSGLAKILPTTQISKIQWETSEFLCYE